jgi:restriction system protein
MALWLMRAGKHGGGEQRFLTDGRIYLTWGDFRPNLTDINDKSSLRALIESEFPGKSKAWIANATGQIWGFARRMRAGDWVVLPSKFKPAIHLGEITGDYTFDRQATEPPYHFRAVRWFAQDIPRSNFDQDILYSLGAFMTVCEIKRNDAERRVREMAKANWVSTPISAVARSGEIEDDESVIIELETVARDQIASQILARFKGHGMARLVDSILKAQGYTTHISHEGPDKGVDILAAPGPMGFGQPRICVQVKSGHSPLDRPTLDQLIGAMQNVQASQGLLVSWGGFKSSIDKEKAAQFFRVRLWDQSDLIEQLLRASNTMAWQLQ